jgi:hypothetical protein
VQAAQRIRAHRGPPGNACGFFHNPWIMPGFGLVTGSASDWLAVNLIFIPREPKKLLGFIPVHGVLHAQRNNVTRDYAHILANDLFSADLLLEAILDPHLRTPLRSRR